MSVPSPANPAFASVQQVKRRAMCAVCYDLIPVPSTENPGLQLPNGDPVCSPECLEVAEVVLDTSAGFEMDRSNYAMR